MYWTVNIYQLLVIIFISKLSVITGDSETVMTDNKSTGVGARIVNGTKVAFGRFKYIVSLRSTQRKHSFCGGSLITDIWIITAAHCLARYSPSESKITVVAGVLNIHPSDPSRQDRFGKNWILHPDYDDKTLHKDIALLRVNRPFELNEYLEPISRSTTTPAAGSICTVAGWGIIKEEAKVLSNYLLSIDIPVIDYARCRKLFGGRFERDEICAGYVEGGTDSCSGDSGGPMECNGELTGVVSGGWGCARPSHPGRYMDVSYFTDWINDYIVPDTVTTFNGPSPTNRMSIMSLSPFLYLFSLLLLISIIEYMFLW